jgi:hypothetical protein
VGGDVSIDSDTLLVTDFVNLKIKSAQSFRCAYSDRKCVCIFIGVTLQKTAKSIRVQITYESPLVSYVIYEGQCKRS